MTEQRQSTRNIQQIISITLMCIFTGLIVVGGLDLTTPVFFSPNQQLRAHIYSQDRMIFTTYFYWYRAPCNETYTLEDQWKVGNYTFPEEWPGPTTMEGGILKNGWHDALTYHPPAQQPNYTIYGEVDGPLQSGIMENISAWFDWMNGSWHEWELRCMMRAGIDVLMPVYWWNGVHNYWAHEGLVTLVNSWHNLSDKVAHEADLLYPAQAPHGQKYGESVLPKIAMFFDVTCMKQLYCWNRSMTEGANYTKCMDKEPGPNLDDPYWRDAFWKCIENFYDIVDINATFNWQDIAGHINNVVWLYSSGWFGDVGTTVFEYCRQKFQQKYNRGLIFIGDAGWLKAGVDGVCGWGACCPGPVLPSGRGIPVGGVGPGYYNLGALKVQTPQYRPRNQTVYKAKWQQLIDKGAAWIHIETWNELFEGTGIAWAQEYGYEWIDVTRAMADVFHNQSGKMPPISINMAEIFFPLVGFVGLCTWGLQILRRKRESIVI